MKLSFTFFIFQSIVINSQTRVKIIDSETQNIIPYATVIFKNSNTYKSAENDGTIEISKDENVAEIQAFGYETLKVNNFQNVYSLNPVYKKIDDVEIYKSKNTIHLQEGKILKEFLPFTFSSSATDFMILNFFDYSTNYPKIAFIKKVRFLSKVNKKESATINIVFYKNIEGKPSGEVWEGFLVVCKKGKNITELNLKNKNIIFPKEVLFIGFEWILNTENTYEVKENLKKFNTKINPQILTQKNSVSTIFLKSKIIHKDTFEFRFPKNENRSLSIELDLSN